MIPSGHLSDLSSDPGYQSTHNQLSCDTQYRSIYVLRHRDKKGPEWPIRIAASAINFFYDTGYDADILGIDTRWIR